MLIDFFFKLREAKLPVTIKEYLVLIEGMKAGLAQFSPEEFYYLARTSLVKNEKHFDRFDQVFAAYYKGAQAHFAAIEGQIPEEWLRKLAEKHLTPEEMAEIEALGEEVRARVRAASGIELTWEIRRIGRPAGAVPGATTDESGSKA